MPLYLLMINYRVKLNFLSLHTHMHVCTHVYVYMSSLSGGSHLGFDSVNGGHTG